MIDNSILKWNESVKSIAKIQGDINKQLKATNAEGNTYSDFILYFSLKQIIYRSLFKS